MLRLSASNLDLETGIAHAFFGRKGGVSEGIYSSLNCGPGSGDNRARVAENRRRAMESLAPFGANLVTLYQVHGRDAVPVAESWEIGHAPKADAMATNVPGIALGILTADCAPVVFADAQARVIGAAHAGWKGALAGVIESVLDAMESLGARRDHISAAIGPCISQPSYEVGDELRAALEQARTDNTQFFMASKRAGHRQFDLSGFAQAQLHRAGIENTSPVPACTYLQDSDFFSYRRATHRGEPDYGRQLSAIMLL
jgi:YfiH family protein